MRIKMRVPSWRPTACGFGQSVATISVIQKSSTALNNCVLPLHSSPAPNGVGNH